MITRRQMGSVALGAAALAGTRGSALAQAPRKGGDVVIAIPQAPPSLDAHITSAQAARNVNLHMYETLYARDESAKPFPSSPKASISAATASPIRSRSARA